jgi:hypothetical protein
VRGSNEGRLTGEYNMRRLRLVVILFANSSAWGAIAACSPGPGPGNAFNTAAYTPTAMGSGCASINLSFENLGLTGATATGLGVTEATANNAFFVTGTGASGNTVGPVTIQFDPTTASNWSINASVLGSTTGATLNYVVFAHTGGTDGHGTYPSPTDTNLQWDFNSLALTPAGSMSGNTGGSNESVTMVICIGATSTSGCAAANTATVTGTINTNTSTFTFGCSTGAGFSWGSCADATSNLINFTTHPVQIAISDTYLVDGAILTGATVTLNNFQNTFGETTNAPEPATLSLVGAMLGLGILYRRRKA